MNRLRELENLLATKGTEAFWDVFEKVRALKAADVKALARPALRHRVQLRPEAELEGASPDGVLDGILASVPVPR